MKVSPGDFLAEWMKAEGVEVDELAQRLRVTHNHLNKVLRGEATLAITFALNLARVTGVPAWIWMRRERTYQYLRNGPEVPAPRRTPTTPPTPTGKGQRWLRSS